VPSTQVSAWPGGAGRVVGSVRFYRPARRRCGAAARVRRTAGPARERVAGETLLYVVPAEIPSRADVASLGQALGRRAPLYELMVSFAAYSGLRWGELVALTAGQISEAGRLVTADQKVIEIRGHLYVEPPKGRKRRRTIYPRRTPAGYPLAQLISRRIAEAGAEQAAGRNEGGLMFPSPTGKYWRSSNFNRQVLKEAYLATGWRRPDGTSRWTWHSLRHVFCTTALGAWGIEVADVSRLAGHANSRVTLEMYVGSVAGALERARLATDTPADTLGRLAATKAQGVSAAAKAQRLYVPARRRPNTPREGARVFVHAGPEHVRALLAAYNGACDASAEVAATLDTIAIALNTPSHILAAARLATTNWREEPAIHRHTVPAWKHAFPHGPAAPPKTAPQPDSSSLTRHTPQARRHAATL
jgi:integrase